MTISREFKRTVQDANELFVFIDYLKHISGYVVSTEYNGTSGEITVRYRLLDRKYIE